MNSSRERPVMPGTTGTEMVCQPARGPRSPCQPLITTV